MKILRKLPEIVLLVILFTIITKQESAKSQISGEIAETHSKFKLEDAKEFFPNAKELHLLSVDLAEVKNTNGDIVGKMMSTSPIADDIIGYAGEVPVVIAVCNGDVIKGVKLLPNYETPHFIRKINRKSFFNSWDKMTVKEALTADVDVVSGASMTTRAVKKGVQLRLSKYLEAKVAKSDIDWMAMLAYAGSLFIVIFALLSFIYPKSFAKKRIYLLIASVIILGFWQGEFISLALMYGWMLNGISITSKFVMLAIVVISFLIPLFTNKAFYCSYVCPYGAAQELTSKLNKRKLRLPVKFLKYLKYAKMVLFYGIVLAVILRFEFDLSEFEPFSAFLYTIASPVVIILATVFLIISIFVPKAWCHYFCPTGYLLDIFRKGKI